MHASELDLAREVFITCLILVPTSMIIVRLRNPLASGLLVAGALLSLASAMGFGPLGHSTGYLMAVAHVRQVPAPDLRTLLRRMRGQVSRAAAAARCASVPTATTMRPGGCRACGHSS